MTANMYYKCRICGSVCNIKYQMGYVKKHPIRYKCLCGITIRGNYYMDSGMSFENADEEGKRAPDFVVYCSGEFFTVHPYPVKSYEETINKYPTPFMLALQILNYEEFRKELGHVLLYRESRHIFVRAINELYAVGNHEKIKELIRKEFDPEERLFPLNNEADFIRATTMINQFQFLNHDGIKRTPRTTNLLVTAFKQNPAESLDFFAFIKSQNILETWKRQVHSLCDSIYERLDLLMPALGVDFIFESKDINVDDFSITTTSFEDVKQLYVDLYELIGKLLVLAIGIDNILLRGDYNALIKVPDLQIENLDAVMKMRNKGNIIKLIDDSAPLQSLIFNSLNASIRNSIGHFSYVSNEVSDSYGQIIEFVDVDGKKKETRSLLRICHDIWQMYKTLGIFHEIIHHVETHTLMSEGLIPSYITDPNIMRKLVSNSGIRKMYPNDLCPCGSGMKYKKCCGKIR